MPSTEERRVLHDRDIVTIKVTPRSQGNDLFSLSSLGASRCGAGPASTTSYLSGEIGNKRPRRADLNQCEGIDSSGKIPLIEKAFRAPPARKTWPEIASGGTRRSARRNFVSTESNPWFRPGISGIRSRSSCSTRFPGMISLPIGSFVPVEQAPSELGG